MKSRRSRAISGLLIWAVGGSSALISCGAQIWICGDLLGHPIPLWPDRSGSPKAKSPKAKSPKAKSPKAKS
jgi:hypothetical protein